MSGQPETQVQELKEELFLLRAAVNRVAFRLDSRAQEAAKVGAIHTSRLYRAAADIVSEELELARIIALGPGAQS